MGFGFDLMGESLGASPSFFWRFVMKQVTFFLDEGGRAPSRAHLGDAGFDLRASSVHLIEPGRFVMVGTGVRVELPEGSVGLVCSRSGLAAKHGVFVLNSPGVVDQDYSGEIGVLLFNAGLHPFLVNVGDRVAQLVVLDRPDLFAVVDGQPDYSEEVAVRSDNGFGSTGVE